MIGLNALKRFRKKRSLDEKVSNQINTETPSQQKGLPTVLTGLSEQDASVLYDVMTVKTFEKGDSLFNGEVNNDAVFFILDGEVSISKCFAGEPLQCATVTSGGWFSEWEERNGNEETKYTAVATKTSRMMFLPRKSFDFLDQKIQLFLYKAMVSSSTDRIHNLESVNGKLAKKNFGFSQSLFDFHERHTSHYDNSQLLKNIYNKIPRLPIYVNKLATQLMQEDTNLSEITDLIKQDPSLAADVLKTINSSYYGLQQKVSDINSAVMLMGFQTLYQLVMAEGVRSDMPETVRFKQLHAHALAVSHFAYAISKTTGIGTPVQLATLGLLHNIGQSVVDLLMKKNPNLIVFLDSINSAKIGSMLLQEWNLPDLVFETIRYQKYPEFASPSKVPSELLPNVAILFIARLCYGRLRGLSMEDLPIIFIEEYMAVLNWQQESLDSIIDTHITEYMNKNQKALPIFMKDLIKKSAS